METHFSNKLQSFQYFCIILHKFQYFCAETIAKLRQISVFWPIFHENFSNKSVISVTKYWNSVTLGSPVTDVIFRNNNKTAQLKMNAISQTTFSSAFSWIKLFEFRLKFHWSVFQSPINNIPSLVQIMVWRRPGAKPLSEPMMVNLLTHLYASIGLNELWAGNSDHQNHHHQSPGCVKNVQRAMTPPWSVGLDQYCKQEWRWTPFLGILSRNGKMTLKVKVNDPHFQY